MLNTKSKIILVFMLFMSVFLTNTQYTDADIFAERMVQRNLFSITTIDFSSRQSASNGPISYIFRTIGLQPGGYDLGAVRIKKEGKLNFKYHIKAIKTNGNDGLCNALNVQVLQRNLTSKYQGKLMDMSIDSNIDNDTPEDWIFIVDLDDKNQALQSKICEFNLNFRTWRTEVDEKKGIFAERILSNVISSGNW